MRIFVDGDSCPYKEEIYRVSHRYDAHVFLVCNQAIRVPRASWIEPIVVGSDFDAVDHWIVANIASREIVITNDILLAKRCVDLGAVGLNTRGTIFDEDSIGEALANRELMQHLRQLGAMDTGPKRAGAKHRSVFLSALDELIQKQKRKTS